MTEHHTIAYSLDTTQRVLQCPHIIDSIMEYAAPQARAVCLRVSRRFHIPAARALYHTVCLSQSNMEAFFRGALVGNGGEDALSECGLAKERGECTMHVPEHLKKFAVWNSTADTMPVGDSSTVNMKAPLLKFVRVLTITRHHSCVCYAYGPHAKSLLPNLDIVRVAPEPRGSHSFGVQCPCDSGHCALLGGIRTRKLVLRNLDAGGVALLDGVREGQAPVPHVNHELVFFLPTDGRRIDTDLSEELEGFGHSIYGADLQSIGQMFRRPPDSPIVKIVFNPTWEGEGTYSPPAATEDPDSQNEIEGTHDGSDGEESSNSDDDRPGHPFPVCSDRLIYTLSTIISSRSRNYVIYGLEKLRFLPDGELLTVFEILFPDTELTQREILKAVRHELRHSSLIKGSSMSPRELEELEYDNKTPYDVTYKTLEEYLEDEGSRRRELAADG